MRRRYLTLALGMLAAGLLVGIFWRRSPPPSFNGQVLLWGGDASGGAPYLIERGPGEAISGFEAELARQLAQRLWVSPRFVQKFWDMLPQDLERGDIDMILNGYEWTPQRERAMASTIPYYVYRLQLLVAPGSPTQNWAGLRRTGSGKRLKVGVLSDSAAHRYVEREYHNDVEIVALSEEGSTGVMRMVREGKLDATVQDLPTALYYVQQQHGYEDLRMVGEPIEPGYYVIFVRLSDTQLRERLNEALRAALRDGSLQRIYEKYGLWNKDQEKLAELAENWSPEEGAGQGLPEYAWLLTKAAGVTVLLACLAMPLAMLIGLLVAIGRLYGPRWLDILLSAYVELLRGTPVLMQLFVIYYLLAGYVDIDAFWAGVFGLAINYSAYEAENYRAGLLAIPRGQMEAALSLGMSKVTALRRIIVPQAVRLVIPPVTNDFISLFKDTSVCSVIAVVELTSRYRTLMVNDPHYRLQLGLITAILYLLMSYPLSLLARRLEHRRK
ncbi:MAG TPA: ABC transporter permease subunit [Gemmataceae bacterium]|jgi:polar amino acid transport system substrate-binding protein